MTGSDPQQHPTGSDLEDATSSPVGADAAKGSAAAGSTTADVSPPTPLTSLNSLLGGGFEGGSACAADGTCD